MLALNRAYRVTRNAVRVTRHAPLILRHLPAALAFCATNLTVG